MRHLQRLPQLLAIVVCGPALALAASPAGPGDFASTPYSFAARRWLEQMGIGDPIDAGSGAFHFRLPLLHLGGPMGLDFDLIYRTDNANWRGHSPNDFPAWYARFWWTPLCIAGVFSDEISVWLEDGTVVPFNADGTIYETPMPIAGGADNGQPVRYVIQKTAGYVYLLNPIRERVYIFQAAGGYSEKGRILYILDRNGNFLHYIYASATDSSPSRIEDNTGRLLRFTYGDAPAGVYPAKYLQFIDDSDGPGRRRITFQCERAADNGDATNAWSLRAVIDALGNRTELSYEVVSQFKDNVTAVRRPRGNTPVTNDYSLMALGGATMPMVTSQTDALGNTTAITYSVNPDGTWRASARDPGGNTTVYEHSSHHGPPTRYTDPLGHTATIAANDREQITLIRDRRGGTTNLLFHNDTGKLQWIADAMGQVTGFTYSPQQQTFTNPAAPGEQVTFTFHNRTRVDFPDGTFETYTYDARGNLLTHTDAAGAVWSYTYDTFGRMLTETNQAGGVTTFTYNADSTLASSQTADTGVTTYQYDAKKRVIRSQFADGTSEEATYDDGDRVTQHVSRRGVITTFQYDANGNLTRRVRGATTPLAQVREYTYDLMDRRVTATDPLGNQTSLAYTFSGALARITHADASVRTFAYDPRSWLKQVVDEAGHVLDIDHDDEGVPKAFTSPGGRTTTAETDAVGRVTQVTDPRGGTLAIERDAVGRIVAITDRLGGETTVTHDGEGRITSITLPVVGTATYVRDGLGQITEITDQRGNQWGFAYTPMGRLGQTTDPLGHTTTFAYDSVGRLTSITHPDGVVEARTYDAGGSLTQRAFTGGLTLGFTYDALGRLVATASHPVALAYDAGDHVVSTTMGGATFGATYDNRGRLATVGYDGQMTVTYTHDARGLLTEASDSRSGSWVRFSYDGDRLLTGIERSNGVDTTVERNANGRPTRITHGTQGELQFTLDAGDRIGAVLESLPLDVAQFLQSETLALAFNAANQVAAAGYDYDARGRRTADPLRAYSWDAASRLTGVTYAGGSIACEYTATGELARRSANGATVDYLYNHALPGLPPVAEKVSGAWRRFYVYSPEGLLLYAVDPQVNAPAFYHFNHIGTTLFLTDAAGAVTDSYGYTPYGRLVRHEGQSDQPFTFVGERGVRQEGSTGLYHMRARVYDSYTGRFLSRDPLWPDDSSGLALNPYQYAVGNPASIVDPSGLSHWVDSSGREVSDRRVRRAIRRHGRAWAMRRYHRVSDPDDDDYDDGVQSGQENPVATATQTPQQSSSSDYVTQVDSGPPRHEWQQDPAFAGLPGDSLKALQGILGLVILVKIQAGVHPDPSLLFLFLAASGGDPCSLCGMGSLDPCSLAGSCPSFDPCSLAGLCLSFDPCSLAGLCLSFDPCMLAGMCSHLPCSLLRPSLAPPATLPLVRFTLALCTFWGGCWVAGRWWLKRRRRGE